MSAQEPPPPALPTKEGSRGPEVKAWQRWLRAHGYKLGRLDGRHGPKTEAATRAWLRDVFDTVADAFVARGW